MLKVQINLFWIFLEFDSDPYGYLWQQNDFSKEVKLILIQIYMILLSDLCINIVCSDLLECKQLLQLESEQNLVITKFISVYMWFIKELGFYNTNWWLD